MLNKGNLRIFCHLKYFLHARLLLGLYQMILTQIGSQPKRSFHAIRLYFCLGKGFHSNNTIIIRWNPQNITIRPESTIKEKDVHSTVILKSGNSSESLGKL